MINEDIIFSTTIDAKDFERLINATKLTVNQKAQNIEFKYIRLEFNAKDNSVSASSTDGYRISRRKVSLADTIENDFTIWLSPTIQKPNKHVRIVQIRCVRKPGRFGIPDEVVYVDYGDIGYSFRQPYQEEWKNWMESVEKAIGSSTPESIVYLNAKMLRDILTEQIKSTETAFEPVISLEIFGDTKPIIIKNGYSNEATTNVILPVRPPRIKK